MNGPFTISGYGDRGMDRLAFALIYMATGWLPKDEELIKLGAKPEDIRCIREKKNADR